MLISAQVKKRVSLCCAVYSFSLVRVLDAEVYEALASCYANVDLAPCFIGLEYGAQA